MGDAFKQIIDEALRGATSPHVLIGPVVWYLREGGDTRLWNVFIGSGNDVDFWVMRLDFAEKPLAEECRAALKFELMQRPSRVIHDFEDELDMARWAEEIWPGEKTRTIRAGIEAERS